MTTTRRWHAVLVAVAALATVLGPAAGVGQADEAGPGAGAATITLTYTNGGVPALSCAETEYTVEGELTGVLSFGGQLYDGTFALTGLGTTWGDSCESPLGGAYGFTEATLTGTTVDGELSCSVPGSFVRQPDRSTGVVTGPCTLDPEPVGDPVAIGDTEIVFAGQFVPGPPGGMLVQTATSNTFHGAFEQSATE